MNFSSQKVWPVAVIGGGIVGICSALALRQRGVDVLLIDPLDEHRRASYGNAGVVSCGSIFPMAGPQVPAKALGYLMGRDPGIRIRKRSGLASLAWAKVFLAHCNTASHDAAARQLTALTRAAWPAHVALAQVVHTQSLLKNIGWIRLYRDAAMWQAAASERALLKSYGVALTDLNAAQLREHEPALSHRYFAGSMINDAGAVQSPEALIRACYQTFRAIGGVIKQSFCRQLQATDESINLLVEDQGAGQGKGAGFDGAAIRAQSVIIAAGVWSGALLKQLRAQLAIALPLAAERGYHQHLTQVAGQSQLTRPVYDVAGGFVMAPTATTSEVRILSGVELARPDDPANYAMLNRVIADARQSLKLIDLPADKPWLGSRPSTPDGLPVIGQIAKDPRIICAFGHGHIGLSTGPLTGQIVADLFQSRPPSIDISGFAPERFSRRF